MTYEACNFPEDYSHENGNYISECRSCGFTFRGNKHRIFCRMCDSEAEPNWHEIANKKTPDLPGAYPGCWIEGEMVGFARCMVKKVAPLKAYIKELEMKLLTNPNNEPSTDNEKAN